jgi:hypothetical protein
MRLETTSLLLCSVVVAIFTQDVPLISIPLSLDGLTIQDKAFSFDLYPSQDPKRALQQFCLKGEVQSAQCRELIGIVKAYLNEKNEIFGSHYKDFSTMNIDNFQWGFHIVIVNMGVYTTKSVSYELHLPWLQGMHNNIMHQFCDDNAMPKIKCIDLVYSASISLEEKKGKCISMDYYLDHMPIFGDYILQVNMAVSSSDGEGKAVTFKSSVYGDDTDMTVTSICNNNKKSIRDCFSTAKYLREQLIIFFGDVKNGNHMSSTIFTLQALHDGIEIHDDDVDTFQQHQNSDGDHLVDMDFIEIGTSNFNTISQLVAHDTAVHTGRGIHGLAVEPHNDYLEQLPVVPGVTKVNAAIATAAIPFAMALELLDDRERKSVVHVGEAYVDFYYIPESTIVKENLPTWLRGTNCIGHHHPTHVYFNLTRFVQIDRVPLLTIEALLTANNVRGIGLLKIDTEGQDAGILYSLYGYLKSKQGDTRYYPKKIIIESNVLSDAGNVAFVIELFCVELGYNVVFSDDDTGLERK